MIKFLGFNFTSLMNLFIRTISLGLKFIFVVFLGKYSNDETNLGVYGIFASSISYSLYLIGFEYYIYVSRKITQESSEIKEYYIKNQLVFYFINYILLFPIILLLLFGYDFISLTFLWVFVITLICEHLGQEMFRLLSIFKRPIAANITLLFRSCWIIFAFVHFIFSKQVDLYFYFQLWAISSFLALLVGGSFIKRDINLSKIIEAKIDYKEIKKGLKISGFFLIASLSNQTIFLSGRFFLDYYFDKGIVGVYTFFSQFINVIEVIIYNLVIMIIFPYLLETAHTDKLKFMGYVSNFKKKLYYILILTVLALSFSMPFIVMFMNKPLATENIYSFYVLIVASIFYNLSLISHYILYSFNKDMTLLYTSLIAVIINISLNLILTNSYGIMGIAFSYLTAMFYMFISKEIHKRRLFHKHIMDNV